MTPNTVIKTHNSVQNDIPEPIYRSVSRQKYITPHVHSSRKSKIFPPKWKFEFRKVTGAGSRIPRWQFASVEVKIDPRSDSDMLCPDPHNAVFNRCCRIRADTGWSGGCEGCQATGGICTFHEHAIDVHFMTSKKYQIFHSKIVKSQKL